MSDETNAGGSGTETGSHGLGPGLAVGSEFAGHRIESELGRGGMGVVYRARHLALDAPRALKVIAPGLSADPVFRERFRRESRLAASIDHPNVVAVHHAGEEGGLLYISMRLVDGRDLREIVDVDGPLAADRARRIFRQVGAGLDAAHAAGLVHRDVKPANVLIDSNSGEERAFLTDFGISRVSGGGSTVTSAGELLGSVDYVAPEQVDGSEVGPETDVYSLGCVAYFALTGEPPFVREGDLARLYAHANAPRPRPSELSFGLTADVDAAIARAMAVRPGDRYPSGGAMATALGGALAKASPYEAPTKPIPRRDGKRRRFGLVAAIAAVTVLAGLAVAAFLVFGGDDSTQTGDGGASAGTVKATIPVSGRPAGIAVGKLAVWVAAEDRADSIELGTDKQRSSEKLPGRPVSVAVDFHAIWVVDRDRGGVVRLDRDPSKAPILIPTGSQPSDVVTAYGSVWVANEDSGTVTRIDPETNTVIKQISVPVPRSLAAGGKAIWVASKDIHTVSKIEAGQNTLEGKPIDVGVQPNDLAFGQGGLWVSDVFEGNVYRIDLNPDPNQTSVVGDPIPVGARPRGIDVGLGSVWVANGADDTVTRINPDDETVVGSPIKVGEEPADITVGDGSVWTADSGAGPGDPTVTQIAP